MDSQVMYAALKLDVRDNKTKQFDCSIVKLNRVYSDRK